MEERDPYELLQTALAVILYRWQVHDERAPIDDLDAVEALHAAVASFPRDHVPLAELYPKVAQLAAISMGVLVALGHPDEVDGLKGFEGFELWRESRRR